MLIGIFIILLLLLLCRRRRSIHMHIESDNDSLILECFRDNSIVSAVYFQCNMFSEIIEITTFDILQWLQFQRDTSYRDFWKSSILICSIIFVILKSSKKSYEFKNILVINIELQENSQQLDRSRSGRGMEI